MIRILSGLLQPTFGTFFINDDSYRKIDYAQYRTQIGTIIQGETPFEGTIFENITFNNPNITTEDLKWALDGVKLSEYIKTLPEGLDTIIFPEGKQLSSSNAQKILMARSIINRPKILFYEDPLDKVNSEISKGIIDFITQPNHKWTIVIASKNDYWKQKCTRTITLEDGKIIADNLKQ